MAKTEDQNSSPAFGHKLPTSPKKNIMLGVIVVIFIIGAALGWHFYKVAQQNVRDRKMADQVFTKSINLATQEIAAQNGKSAISNLNYALTFKLSTSQKRAVFSQLGSAYSLDGQNDKAFAAMQEEYKLAPNSMSSTDSAALAGLYALKGDKQNAIKFYRLAIKAASSETDSTNTMNISMYQGDIKALGGTP